MNVTVFRIQIRMTLALINLFIRIRILPSFCDFFMTLKNDVN
jgi:hypothetical protein